VGTIAGVLLARVDEFCCPSSPLNTSTGAGAMLILVVAHRQLEGIELKRARINPPNYLEKGVHFSQQSKSRMTVNYSPGSISRNL
jgi:hypothetical protein